MSDTKSKHTPGPWEQGRTLTTRETTRWTQERLAANDATEACMVFANFSSSDNGKGRVLVARCERAEDASLIASGPELLDAAKAAWNCIAELSPTQARVEVAQALQAAIAKATGGAP